MAYCVPYVNVIQTRASARSSKRDLKRFFSRVRVIDNGVFPRHPLVTALRFRRQGQQIQPTITIKRETPNGCKEKGYQESTG
jgi:hypothetical protein